MNTSESYSGTSGSSPLITHRKRLFELCRQFRVRRLYAFGSVLTEHFVHGRSDIDLLVEPEEMSPEATGENLIGLWDALEKLFQSKVDLLTTRSLKNPYLRTSVDGSKKLIYDGTGEKILV
jgi:uncharacterized protein